MEFDLNAPPLKQPVGSHVVLEVTYSFSDPDLNSLRHIFFSPEFHQLAKDALSNGRLKNDLWHFGLPLADPAVILIQSLVSDADSDSLSLRIEANVNCTDIPVLTSILERGNASVHPERGNIKSIIMVNNSSLITPTRVSSPITMLTDYHRDVARPHNVHVPLGLHISPSLTQRDERSHVMDTAFHVDLCSQTKDFVATHPPHFASGMKTPPESPHRATKNKIITSVSTIYEDCVRSEIEEEMRADFETVLAERMAELQVAFNQEKSELESRIDNSRAEFEVLLAERLAEVQREFNARESELRATIVQAEGRAKHERILRQGCERCPPTSLSHIHSPRCEVDADHQVESANTQKLFESQLFAATLEAKLQEGRLKDMRGQWERSEEQLAQSRRQMEDMERALECSQAAMSSTKSCLTDVEIIEGLRCQDCMKLDVSMGEEVDYEIREKLETPAQRVDDDEGVGSTVAECLRVVVPCPSCDVKDRSLRFSELHVRVMELRMSMFERKFTQSENYVVWLVHALQEERRRRKHAEAYLQAERQKALDAEVQAEAISMEATWPFVVPKLLELFLKFEETFGDQIITV